MRCFALLLIFVCLWVLPAGAATYYVATTGSDGNSCTTAQTSTTPKRNLGGASGGLACLVAGDTLSVAAGTYTETINSYKMQSGTASQPITIALASGVTVTGWPVRLYGLPQTQYVIIDGGTFTGNNACLYLGAGGSGTAPANITIRGVHMHNCSGQGIIVHGSGHTIQRSEIHNIGKPNCAGSGAGFCHGIYAEDATDILVEYNHIYDTDGIGVKVGQAGTTSDVTVRYNLIHDWAQDDYSSAILFGSGSTNSVAHNNVLYGCTGVDISGNGIDAIQFWRGSNNAAYYNTIHVTGTACSGIRNFHASSSLIKNNIVYGGSGGNVVTTTCSGSECPGSSYTATGNMCPASGTGCSVVNVSAGFVDSATQRYDLLSTSAAIGAAASISPCPDGIVCGSDIGAFQTWTFTNGTVETATPNRACLNANTAFQPVMPASSITGFSGLEVAAGARTITAVTRTQDSQFCLDFSGAAVTSGQSVTVDYSPGNATNCQDIGRGFGAACSGKHQRLNALTDFAVTNNVGGGSPTITLVHGRVHAIGEAEGTFWLSPQDVRTRMTTAGCARFRVCVRGSGAAKAAIGWKPQWRKNAGSWTDLGTATSANVFLGSDTKVALLGATANQCALDGATFAAGAFLHTSLSQFPVAGLAINEQREWDVAVCGGTGLIENDVIEITIAPVDGTTVTVSAGKAPTVLIQTGKLAWRR